MEQNIAVIHIQFEETMTMGLLAESIMIAEDAIREAYRERILDHAEYSPEIIKVKKGSFVSEIILPFASIIVPIIYDILKEKTKEKKYRITIAEKRHRWTEAEDRMVSEAVIAEYVEKRSAKAAKELASELCNKTRCTEESMLDKIKNTKALLEEKNISNTLSCGALQHYSQQHKKAFEIVCKKHNVQ